MSFNATVPLTKIDEKTVRVILQEYKIFNCEVYINSGCIQMRYQSNCLFIDKMLFTDRS